MLICKVNLGLKRFESESCPNKMEIDLEKIRQNDIFFWINKK